MVGHLSAAPLTPLAPLGRLSRLQFMGSVFKYSHHINTFFKDTIGEFV